MRIIDEEREGPRFEGAAQDARAAACDDAHLGGEGALGQEARVAEQEPAVAEKLHERWQARRGRGRCAQGQAVDRLDHDAGPNGGGELGGAGRLTGALGASVEERRLARLEPCRQPCLGAPAEEATVQACLNPRSAQVARGRAHLDGGEGVVGHEVLEAIGRDRGEAERARRSDAAGATHEELQGAVVGGVGREDLAVEVGETVARVARRGGEAQGRATGCAHRSLRARVAHRTEHPCAHAARVAGLVGWRGGEAAGAAKAHEHGVDGSAEGVGRQAQEPARLVHATVLPRAFEVVVRVEGGAVVIAVGVVAVRVPYADDGEPGGAVRGRVHGDDAACEALPEGAESDRGLGQVARGAAWHESEHAADGVRPEPERCAAAPHLDAVEQGGRDEREVEGASGRVADRHVVEQDGRVIELGAAQGEAHEGAEGADLLHPCARHLVHELGQGLEGAPAVARVDHGRGGGRIGVVACGDGLDDSGVGAEGGRRRGVRSTPGRGARTVRRRVRVLGTGGVRDRERGEKEQHGDRRSLAPPRACARPVHGAVPLERRGRAGTPGGLPRRARRHPRGVECTDRAGLRAHDPDLRRLPRRTPFTDGERCSL